MYYLIMCGANEAETMLLSSIVLGDGELLESIVFLFGLSIHPLAAWYHLACSVKMLSAGLKSHATPRVHKLVHSASHRDDQSHSDQSVTCSSSMIQIPSASRTT